MSPLAVLGQPGGQLGKGIQDVNARIAQNEQHINQLENAVTGYVLKIGKIIYTAYGQKGDPGRALLDLQDKIEQDLETIAAARSGQPNTDRIAQLILDEWSELNPVVKNINASQQLLGQLAPLVEALWERNNYQQQIATDTQILGRLEAENANLGQQSSNSPSAPPPPAPTVIEMRTQAIAFDFSALDDSVLVSRWLDMGNRAFANRQEEDGFYRKHPEFSKYRQIADYRSPESEVEQDLAKKSAPTVRDAAAPIRLSESCRSANTVLQGLQGAGSDCECPIPDAPSCDPSAVAECRKAWMGASKAAADNVSRECGK